MYLFENKGENLDPSGFQVEACCNLKNKKSDKKFFFNNLKKLQFLPFKPLQHLYSPQLTRMAFEAVIKCLCSTRPLHYS